MSTGHARRIAIEAKNLDRITTESNAPNHQTAIESADVLDWLLYVGPVGDDLFKWHAAIKGSCTHYVRLASNSMS